MHTKTRTEWNPDECRWEEVDATSIDATIQDVLTTGVSDNHVLLDVLERRGRIEWNPDDCVWEVVR